MSRKQTGNKHMIHSSRIRFHQAANDCKKLYISRSIINPAWLASELGMSNIFIPVGDVDSYGLARIRSIVQSFAPNEVIYLTQDLAFMGELGVIETIAPSIKQVTGLNLLTSDLSNYL